MGTGSSQPNLILIMADQMAAPFISPWGGPAKTPAIDRLAEEGVVFSSTYSNSPLCAPARFAMMAGRYNSRIGAYDNASEFTSTVPTFAHFLRAAGYQTSLVGKMHFVGADQLHGFEERLTTDIYPADFGWTPNWEDPDGRFDWWYHNLDSVVHAGLAEATNQLDYDDEVGFRTIRKLRDLARTTDDRPWFVTASFTHPHDPYVARQGFWDRYDHDEIPMPTVGPIAEDAEDPHSRRLRHVMMADVTEVTDNQIRNARHAYFANCSYVDDWVGQVLRTLELSGMADDTIVILTADHGDMLGERGLWYKMNFFEASTRVPLIVWAPWRFEHRQVTTHTSLLDIAPTLADLGGAASAEVMEDLDGNSLVRLLDGDEDPDRLIAGEYLGEGAVAPIFLLRAGTLKYVWSEPDGAQLFDLATDPNELTNLATDPAQAETVAAFGAEIHRRWSPGRLRDQVVDNQRSRRMVDSALRQGRFTPWDFQPSTDATQQYMRNHLDLNEVEAGRRLG
ncbi:MAG: choline-sulfatase [Actinomycetota bacterium]